MNDDEAELVMLPAEIAALEAERELEVEREAATSPVAAESLRERVAEAITRYDWEHGLAGNGEPGQHQRGEADAVMAELVGDPGDLPARMAEAIRAEFNKTAVVCEHTQVISFGALAAAALSVRCEVHAATVAENAELRRREEHAVKEHQVTRERLAEARREVAELRRTPLAAEEEIRRLRAGLVTESRAADDVIADLEELIKTERQQHEATLAEVERLQAELAEIERVTTPPDAELEIPTDPAELRELWEFINRQTRWQYQMAHKFGGRVGQLRAELAEAYLRVNELSKKEDQQFRRAEKAEAERDALKAANERVRAVHIISDMGECIDCRASWPCPTIAALTAPETPGDAPAKPRHIGGRANAEDCPACTGDLPYPWICPGEPETPGDAERIADERPTGVHAFKQNPAATQVSVCICGKWRDHHMHGADPCGCDACRTPGDAEEATDER